MIQIKEPPAALPLEDDSPGPAPVPVAPLKAETEMHPPRALRTGNWLARLAIIVALALAPVLAAQAMAAPDTPAAVQNDLAAMAQNSATGAVAPPCYNGALCAFVGSLALHAAMAAPVSRRSQAVPEIPAPPSWAALPNGHPPKQL